MFQYSGMYWSSLNVCTHNTSVKVDLIYTVLVLVVVEYSE
jgi:hypothetical protein